MCKVLKPAPQTTELRRALGHFATGVAIVTTVAEHGRPVGLTINSFSAVSLVPALVSWCVDRRASSYSDFACCERFAVTVLSHHQQDIAWRFSRPGADKFTGLQPVSGEPLFIPEGTARFECEVYNRFLLGDHLMLVGRVLSSECFETEPLIFSRGEFKRLTLPANHHLATTA